MRIHIMKNIKHKAEVYDGKSICDMMSLKMEKLSSRLENPLTFLSFVLEFNLSRKKFLCWDLQTISDKDEYLLCK